MAIINYIDSIKEYQSAWAEYASWEAEVEQYNALPFYRQWFTKNPMDCTRRKYLPKFYSVSEFSNHRIGGVLYSIKVEVRAYDGEFFLAMCEETPEGIQGCKFNLNMETEPLLGGKYAYTKDAKAFVGEVMMNLKSIL